MVYQLLQQYDAKNWTPGASAGRKVTGITIHWWGNPVGQTFEGILDWFCNPKSSVTTSAHYVAEAGRVACIVNPDDVAWHAGDWGANVATIGIECNPRATDADYQTIGELVAYLRGIYGNVPLYPHRHWTQTTCPGAYDVARIDAIAKGTKLVAANPQGAVGPASNTTVTPIQEDDMPLSDADIDKIAKRSAEFTWLYDYKVSGRPGKPLWILQSLDGIVANVVKQTVDGVTAPILKAVASVPGVDPAQVKAALADAAAQIKVNIDTQAIAKQAADELGKRVSNG